jgi:4-aminobutyrate aminotransferase-like enzyme
VTVPGPRSAALARKLRRYEQRNVTYLADDFPIFWESAHDATVVDVDGNEYLDCTAAFGVANAGHCNPRVAQAVADQAQRLVHGMGDVHPTEIRIGLFQRLASVLPKALDRFFLATTGSEAVEAALKTAMLATGKSRFAAYAGAYHGLSFGALAVGGIPRFRDPFAARIPEGPLLLDFPGSRCTGAEAASAARTALRSHPDVAALLVEPIQGRAGCIVPPAGYLHALREVCDELGILLIVDEIFTGFGRTGSWFAVDREGVVPDLLCIGKAMGSGVPISAVAGRTAVMDAWPPSTGEALHTSTYLGNPLACAAAIATIDELHERDLPGRAARLGAAFAPSLQSLAVQTGVVEVRGAGLCWGVQLDSPARAARVVRAALQDAVIVLQSGVDGEVVSISPPLVIAEDELQRAIDVLRAAVVEAK